MEALLSVHVTAVACGPEHVVVVGSQVGSTCGPKSLNYILLSDRYIYSKKLAVKATNTNLGASKHNLPRTQVLLSQQLICVGSQAVT